eukprot:scaffold1220_cov259-Pinguiococcus_pyrenoidosus.AAC.136
MLHHVPPDRIGFIRPVGHGQLIVRLDERPPRALRPSAAHDEAALHATQQLRLAIVQLRLGPVYADHVAHVLGVRQRRSGRLEGVADHGRFGLGAGLVVEIQGSDVVSAARFLGRREGGCHGADIHSIPFPRCHFAERRIAVLLAVLRRRPLPLGTPGAIPRALETQGHLADVLWRDANLAIVVEGESHPNRLGRSRLDLIRQHQTEGMIRLFFTRRSEHVLIRHSLQHHPAAFGQAPHLCGPGVVATGQGRRASGVWRPRTVENPAACDFPKLEDLPALTRHLRGGPWERARSAATPAASSRVAGPRRES